MPLRVRHHTNDEGLAGIRRMGGIQAGRGWGRFETGVHVEVEPFGTAMPSLPKDQSSPLNDFGCCGEGAFVEFDRPGNMAPYSCGPRYAGFVPVPLAEYLPLDTLNPIYVKVRRHWWQWWRTKVE